MRNNRYVISITGTAPMHWNQARLGRSATPSDAGAGPAHKIRMQHLGEEHDVPSHSEAIRWSLGLVFVGLSADVVPQSDCREPRIYAAGTELPAVVIDTQKNGFPCNA